MPFNGSGSFSAPVIAGWPAVSGAVISSTAMNAVINDILAGLSAVLVRDGQSAMTGDLDMGGNQILNLTFAKEAKASDLLSATTCDIGGAPGRSVDVTGTTTITGFGTATVGTWKIVRFTGILTLTHNATKLILPGGANITTAAGDCLIALSLGLGNWVVLTYQPAVGLVRKDGDTISGDLIVNGTLTVPMVVTESPMSFRNKIINGGFDIWQVAASQTSAGYGSDDMWVNYHLGTTKTHSRQAFTLGQIDVPGNPRYFSRTVVNSVPGAGNYCYKQTKIEGIQTLAGRTITFSFYAKADAARYLAVEFGQTFGTGGAPSADVNTFIGKPLLTAEWQKFVFTFTAPSISGKTMGTNGDDLSSVVFWFDAGSAFDSRTNSLGQQSGTFDIAQGQLEEGDVATPFERRPIGLELSLCQRYYEKSDGTAQCFSGQVSSGSQYYQSIRFAVAKRAAPTMVGVVQGTPTSFPTTDPSFPAAWLEGSRAQTPSATATAIAFYAYAWTADARL